MNIMHKCSFASNNLSKQNNNELDKIAVGCGALGWGDIFKNTVEFLFFLFKFKYETNGTKWMYSEKNFEIY